MQQGIRFHFSVDGTAGCTNKYHGLSDFHDLPDENALTFRQPQILFVTGGEFVPGIAFFAFNGCIQSQAKNNGIRTFCNRFCFGVAVTCLCQGRASILV